MDLKIVDNKPDWIQHGFEYSLDSDSYYYHTDRYSGKTQYNTVYILAHHDMSSERLNILLKRTTEYLNKTNNDSMKYYVNERVLDKKNNIIKKVLPTIPKESYVFCDNDMFGYVCTLNKDSNLYDASNETTNKFYIMYYRFTGVDGLRLLLGLIGKNINEEIIDKSIDVDDKCDDNKLFAGIKKSASIFDSIKNDISSIRLDIASLGDCHNNTTSVINNRLNSIEDRLLKQDIINKSVEKLTDMVDQLKTDKTPNDTSDTIERALAIHQKFPTLSIKTIHNGVTIVEVIDGVVVINI